MDTIKNVGLIECGTLHKPLYVSPVSILKGYTVKKVLSTDGTIDPNINNRYPGVEIVEHTKDILDDSTIDLVIVSDPAHEDMDIVGEVLQSGKQMRII
jgi:hypothetical protein